jgi:hypothetical protein
MSNIVMTFLGCRIMNAEGNALDVKGRNFIGRN